MLGAQPLRAGDGHQVEVGLDVGGRLAADELEAVREPGAGPGDGEPARAEAAGAGAGSSSAVGGGGRRVVGAVAGAGAASSPPEQAPSTAAIRTTSSEQDQRPTGAQGAAQSRSSASDFGSRAAPAAVRHRWVLASNGCSL